MPEINIEKMAQNVAQRATQELRDNGVFVSRWISVEERLPEAEKEVQICAVGKLVNGKSHTIITHAMYEDGNIRENDSIWGWHNLDFDADWDEKEDCCIIPEGWWEYNHYLNPDYEEYNHLIDDKVIAWMPLPEPPEEVAE